MLEKAIQKIAVQKGMITQIIPIYATHGANNPSAAKSSHLTLLDVASLNQLIAGKFWRDSLQNRLTTIAVKSNLSKLLAI